MNAEHLAAALARAYAEGILVARLSDDTWRAQSSEPALRGPYLVVLDDDGEGHCGCLGGRYREPCKHRVAAYVASAGGYPISELSAIRGPADSESAPAAGHVYRPPARVARAVAEHERATATQRATALPVTERDYQDLFPD